MGLTTDPELMVRVLSAGLGLDAPLTAPPPAVLEHIAAGEHIKAVREMRRRAPGKLSLLAAKRMVDALSER